MVLLCCVSQRLHEGPGEAEAVVYNKVVLKLFARFSEKKPAIESSPTAAP